jgi:hypothetical protein
MLKSSLLITKKYDTASFFRSSFRLNILHLPSSSITLSNEGSSDEPQEKKRKESHNHKSSIALAPIPSLEFSEAAHAIVLFLIR